MSSQETIKPSKAAEKIAAQKIIDEKAAEKEEKLRLGKVSEENKILKSNRQKVANAKKYQVKPGTGKQFHIALEIPGFDSSTGERFSQTVIQIMDYKTFMNWLKNASKLGYVFGMRHDASPFHKKEEVLAIIEKLKDHIRSSNVKHLEYGKELANGPGVINEALRKFSNMRVEHEEGLKRQQSKENDYLS